MTYESELFFRACENGDVEECKRIYNLGDKSTSSCVLLGISRQPKLNLQQGSSGYGARPCPALHAAAWNGHTDVVRFLLQVCRVDVDERVSRGLFFEGRWFRHETALFRACQNSHMETCRVLLEAGATNLWGCSYLAVMRGNVPLLKLLIKHGANPEIEYANPGHDDNPPLHIAITRCQPEILEVLLEAGCNFFQSGSLFRSLSQVSMNSSQTSREDRVRMFQLLVRHAPKQVTDCVFSLVVDKDWTRDPCFKDTLVELLEADTNINVENEWGRTPIICTLERTRPHGYWHPCHKGYQNILQKAIFLAAHGADPSAGGHFDSCFNYVMRNANEKLVQWILFYWNAKYGNETSGGNFPIHKACCYPETSVKAVELLLKDNPESLKVVHEGNDLLPIQIACLWGMSLDVVYTLLRFDPSTLQSQHQHHQATNDDNASGLVASRPSKRQKLSFSLNC